MANNSSINAILGDSAVNYDSLMSKASGVHNRGEIVFKKGFFGGFSRVNYHVGFWSGLNTVVTTAEQNRLTRAAVFKAILDKYDALGDHADILNKDFDSEKGRGAISAYLDGEGKNPYLKEAFKFLLCGGVGDNKNPLSRDEMKMLDALLRKGSPVNENVQNRNFVIDEDVITQDFKTLEGLRDIKRYGVDNNLTEQEFIDAQNAALEWVQGLKVAKISEDKKGLMLDPTVNMAHGRVLVHKMDDSEDSEVRALAPVLNKISNNVCAAPKLPKPYRNNSDQLVVHKVTEFQINRMVDKLIDGVSEAIIYSAGRVADYNDCNKGAKLNSLDVRLIVVKDIVEKLNNLYPEQMVALGSKSGQGALDKMINDIRAFHHNSFTTGVKAKYASGLRTLKEDVLIALKNFAKSRKVVDLGYRLGSGYKVVAAAPVKVLDKKETGDNKEMEEAEEKERDGDVSYDHVSAVESEDYSFEQERPNSNENDTITSVNNDSLYW